MQDLLIMATRRVAFGKGVDTAGTHVSGMAKGLAALSLVIAVLYFGRMLPFVGNAF